MIFDTDVLILMHRADPTAVNAAEAAKDRLISAQTAMEFLQAAPDRKRQKELKSFLSRQGFSVLPISEPISHRALDLVETHSLGDGLRAGDALIAATALEHDLPLCTGNVKHFRPIRGLTVKGMRS